jgi:Flp pilus assembly protein protease CpaA
MKKRIIPNRLTFPLIGGGILFYALLGVLSSLGAIDLSQALTPWGFWIIFLGAFGAALAFGIGYALWLTGGWAGGDVKLFTAFGALLPFYDAPFTGNIPYPFPITILFNSVIAMLPILLVYSLIRRARGQSVLYERVKITELREGMIPAELIYEKDGKIMRGGSRFGIKPSNVRIYADPSRAAGLTRYQVGVLKRLAREQKLRGWMRLKRGIPFAPALGAGLFIGVLYGDLYLTILTKLVGF